MGIKQSLSFSGISWGKVFMPLTKKQTIILSICAFFYGGLFINYAEYSVFASTPFSAAVPPLYHLWLELFYVIPFISILLFYGPSSIVFVYVMGRIASLGNDFLYPVYAKLIMNSYSGDIFEWWKWLAGFGTGNQFSWTVEMPIFSYQMTSTLMGINLIARLALIVGFFLIARRLQSGPINLNGDFLMVGKFVTKRIPFLNEAKAD